MNLDQVKKTFGIAVNDLQASAVKSVERFYRCGDVMLSDAKGAWVTYADHRDAIARLTAENSQLQEQLDAVGAGGVESLRQASRHAAAPAVVAAPDVREAFALEIRKHNPHANLECHDGQYASPWVQAAWTGFSLRAALAPAPLDTSITSVDITPRDKGTQDQIASVMLQHGTPEQQARALAYASTNRPHVPTRIMQLVDLYGASRADNDGQSGKRIGELTRELRDWAATIAPVAPAVCIRYDLLHTYAEEHGVSYNVLCKTVHDSLTTPPPSPLSVVFGDKLPAIGSVVYIRHGRDDDAHACVVNGYYVWPDLGGNKSLHRVFVRMVYQGTTTEQARMLRDCYPTAEDALAAGAPDDELMVDATPPATSRDRWMYEQGRLAELERICAAIKTEDDYCVDQGDYMLDSDDCIKVARGTWLRPTLDRAAMAAAQEGGNASAKGNQ